MPRTGHVPDAEVHWPGIAGRPYADQVWALEVELTPKPVGRTTEIMTGLLASAKYATVVYLTAPGRPADSAAGGGRAAAHRPGAGGGAGPAARGAHARAPAMSVRP